MQHRLALQSYHGWLGVVIIGIAVRESIAVKLRVERLQKINSGTALLHDLVVQLLVTVVHRRTRTLSHVTTVRYRTGKPCRASSIESITRQTCLLKVKASES